jgi:hypothetical protein
MNTRRVLYSSLFACAYTVYSTTFLDRPSDCTYPRPVSIWEACSSKIVGKIAVTVARVKRSIDIQRIHSIKQQIKYHSSHHTTMSSKIGDSVLEKIHRAA